MSEQPRLPLSRIAPEGYRAMAALGAAVDESARKSGLEDELIHLLKIRISQVNACAFCIDMHIIDARAEGVSEQRIDLLSGWQHAVGIYNDRERTALEFAESITRLEQSGVPDEVYDRVRKVFSEDETGQLIFLGTVMNSWNRLAVSARMVPGNYKRG